MTDEAARPFRRRVLLNTAATGLGNGWAMVVTLVSLPLLLSGLGSAAFGTWVLLSTFSAITGWLALADLGVTTAATRAVAERASLDDRRGVATTVSSGLTLLTGLGVGFALVLATIGRRWLPMVFDTPVGLVADLRFAILAFAIQIVADLLTNAAGSALEGLQRVDLSRAVDAVRRTSVAVATSVIALTGGGLRGVAVGSLCVSLFSALLALAVLRRRLPDRWHAPDWSTMRSLLRSGRSMAVLRPFGAIQRTMDRLIVGVVLGPSAVALVEIGTQIQNGADAVLSASSYSVIPGASWLNARDDRHTLRELLDKGTKYSLLVTMPFVIGGVVLAGPLVRVWVGTGYERAAVLAAFGLLYIGVSAPLQVGSNLLVGVGRASAVARAAALAVGVNLLVSVVLVHLIGPEGAFLGSIVGALVLVVPLGGAFLAQVDSAPGEFVRRAVVPVVLPGLALAAVTGAVLLAPLGDIATLVLGVAAGSAAYTAVAAAWSLDRKELQSGKDLLRRGPSGPATESPKAGNGGPSGPATESPAPATPA